MLLVQKKEMTPHCEQWSQQEHTRDLHVGVGQHLLSK
jgi:hypothetical protein